jgi:hypothetical protein
MEPLVLQASSCSSCLKPRAFVGTGRLASTKFNPHQIGPSPTRGFEPDAACRVAFYFSRWQPDFLNQTAGFGQKRTDETWTLERLNYMHELARQPWSWVLYQTASCQLIFDFGQGV